MIQRELQREWNGGDVERCDLPATPAVNGEQRSKMVALRVTNGSNELDR